MESINQSKYISNDELSMLYQGVLLHTTFFKLYHKSHTTIWDEVIPYLDRLLSSNNPHKYVYTIINEITEASVSITYSCDRPSISKSSILSFQLYVILRYIYKSDSTFREPLLTPILDKLGPFKDNHWAVRISDIDRLPDYEPTITEDGDVQAVIETGQGVNTTTHKITASKAAKLVMATPGWNGIKKEDWHKLLSNLTGLSSSTFKSHLR